MNFSLSLDWTRCPDGVEVYDNVHSGLDSSGYIPSWLEPITGEYVRFKSEAYEIIHFESTSHLDSLVLKFASADTKEKLLRFLSNYGMPSICKPHEEIPDEKADFVYSAYEEYIQTRFRTGESLAEIRSAQVKLLKLFQSGSVKNFTDQFSAGVEMTMPVPEKGQRPGLMLHPNDLFQFMKIEAALIVCGPSEVKTCSHCSDLFAKGGEKAKRTDSKYCSPRCRLAAHRLRKKTATKQRSKRKRTK